MTSCTETSVGLSASENPNADPRTARVTVSYPYSVAGTKGTASCEITVAQSCGDQPAISVQPTAVAAAVEGGSYSFEYTIVNPAPDGEVGASCTASWISDIDCSAEGTVGFEVAENPTTALRQTEITLTYSWGNGSISESVTVVQDHEGGSDSGDGGSGGDIDSLVGTYTASGYAYYASGVAAYTTWTLTIYKSGDNEVIIDGLVPEAEGEYPSTEAYIARASLNSNGQLVIPTQYTGYYNQNNGYYIGWTPCVDYETGEGWYYDKSWPDCTVTYDPSTGVWTSDYGMFLALLTTNSLSTASFAGFYDVTNPGFQFTKSGDLPDDGGDVDMIGTYTAHALVNGQGYSYEEVDWTVKIYPYEGSLATGSYDYWMDGVIPWGEGYYVSTGDHRASAGIKVSGTTIRVPTQFAHATLATSSASYYLMYTPCTKYDSATGNVSYSSSWPDLVFTYNSSTGVWTSNYGIFMGGSTSSSSFALNTYFQVATPVITLTKTSDTTSLSADDGNRPVTSFENLVPYSNFKVSSAPASNAGLVTCSLGSLNMADAKPAK